MLRDPQVAGDLMIDASLENSGDKPERTKVDAWIAVVLSIVAAAVLSPIIGFIGAATWYFAGGKNSSGIFGSTTAVVAFALIVWRSNHIFRSALQRWSRVPEPISSSTKFGLIGSFVCGAFMLTGILLLGHMRPLGWEFDRILPAMAMAFGVCFVAGLSVGLFRKYRRNSQRQ